jgi:hypothetical protein
MYSSYNYPGTPMKIEKPLEELADMLCSVVEGA